MILNIEVKIKDDKMYSDYDIKMLLKEILYRTPTETEVTIKYSGVISE